MGWVIKSGLKPSQNIHTEFDVFFNRIDISIEAYSMPPLEKRIGLFSLTNRSRYPRYSFSGMHIVKALLACEFYIFNTKLAVIV